MEKDKKIINRQNINKDEKSEQIKKIAKQLLKEIGIKVNLLGFKYWQTALALVIEDEGKIVMIFAGDFEEMDCWLSHNPEISGAVAYRMKL